MNFKDSIIKFALGVALCPFLILNLFVTPVYAQQDLGTQSGQDGGFVFCGNTADDPCQIGDLFAGFVIIINYLITMAGFVAVLAIVYSGFLMVFSAGEARLANAKKRLAGAIVGLLLVAGAFIAINSIFAGSFSIGVCNGENILTDPVKYINSVQDDQCT